MKKKPTKFHIKIFGCQYNEWDSARLSFQLKKSGLIEESIENCEVIITLNCSVRQTAVDRTIGYCRNFLEAGKIVVVSGCILESDRKKFEKKGIVIWDGKSLETLNKIFELKIVSTKDDNPSSTNLIPIMKGCNNFCSYCAVPYTRGRETSRPMDKVLDDVQRLVEAGQKEIWLLGQNVNSYRDSEKQKVKSEKLKSDFATLLERIDEIPGDFIVYFTSNHPKDMTDDIIEVIAKLPKIAKRIHLPLQSGSDKILKAMHRPYSQKQYLRLVKKLKDKIPGVEITTDTIVGFPGETEEDFQQTIDVFKIVRFSQAFNNKYSPRSGTVAYKLGDPISWEEKQRRWRILDQLANHKL